MKQLDRTHILTRIIEAKQKRLQVAKMRVPEPIVQRMAETAKPVPSFQDALEQPQRVRIIAEVKKASPSKGVLKADLDPATQAAAYRRAGASAISVVTEEDFSANNYAKWFHVAEHESNHDGQIKFLKRRLPGAKDTAE